MTAETITCQVLPPETTTPTPPPKPAKVKLPKLQPRHAVFLRRFIEHGCQNASLAARQAGYKSTGSSRQAYDMLHRPDILAHLAHYQDQCTAQPSEVTAFWSRQMRANIGTMITPTGEIDVDQVKANGDIVQSYQPGTEMLPAKVRLEPRLPASLALARFHGMLKDDASGPQIAIQVIINGNPANI